VSQAARRSLQLLEPPYKRLSMLAVAAELVTPELPGNSESSGLSEKKR